jgi:uncharacterized protein
MKNYQKLKKLVLKRLNNDLPIHLTYHAVDHTLDVLEVCNQYIERLSIGNNEACLLRIGALVHDMGFLKTYKNHEETSSEMAEEIMAKLEMSREDIEIVKGLILATKIPQTPLNTLQEIICDADLDYLGRDDYPQISTKLYEELVASKIIERADEWRDLQINFLKNHTFHTAFARANREPKKQYWLNQIINQKS